MQLKKMEQNLQHKDESMSQMNDRIKEVMKKLTEMKRQTEASGQGSMNQLDERRMVKKLEDKINQKIKSVDDSCAELWQQQNQYNEILRQQDLKYEQLKKMIDQIVESQDNRRNNLMGGGANPDNSQIDNYSQNDEDDDDQGDAGAGGGARQIREAGRGRGDPVVRQSEIMEYLESLRAEIQVFNQDQNDQLRQ